MTEQEILKVRSKIFQEYGISTLQSVGFEKSPFSSDWFGKDNTGSFSYNFCRLNNSFLETIEVQITRGDRWIKIFLNIFELTPSVSNLEILRNYDAIKYKIPPSSLTEMRITQDDFQGMPLFNFKSNRHKLQKSFLKKGLEKSIERLGKNIKYDLTSIEFYIEKWHKLNRPLKVDWNGRLFGIDKMTLNEKLASTSLKQRFDKSAYKEDFNEMKRILKWLELDESSINNTIKNYSQQRV